MFLGFDQSSSILTSKINSHLSSYFWVFSVIHVHQLVQYACSTVSLFLLFQIRTLCKILLLLHCWLEHVCNEKIQFASEKSTINGIRTHATFLSFYLYYYHYLFHLLSVWLLQLTVTWNPWVWLTDVFQLCHFQ